MTLSRTLLSRTLLLTGLALAAGLPAHAQGLLGQPVNVNFFNTETARHVIADYGTQTIFAGGNTFTAPAQTYTIPFTVFVTPTQITYTATAFAAYGNNNFSFATSEVSSLPATITAVTVDPSTTVTGFPAAHLTFDGSDVFAEIAGTNFQSGQKLVLDVVSTPAAVPEASTTVSFGLLLALGLGGFVVAKKKKAHA